jgi:hypothetical protein
LNADHCRALETAGSTDLDIVISYCEVEEDARGGAPLYAGCAALEAHASLFLGAVKVVKMCWF